MDLDQDGQNDDHSTSVAIVESGAKGLSVMARAEIDMQITTARAYPRQASKVRKSLIEMVTLDDEAAKECMYALPRGGKPIVGPSIRFAEALKQGWGNCRAASRICEINREEKYVEAEGIFHDLETNTVTRVTHRRPISGRSGSLFSLDMIMVTGNAAASVAMRESILKGIPKPVWRAAYEAVVKVIAGDVRTIAVNRDLAVKAFAVWGIKPEQVFEVLKVASEEDITLDHLVVLRGMFAAIRNNEATVEEVFFAKGQKPHDPNYNPLVKDKPEADGGQANNGGANQENTQTHPDKSGLKTATGQPAGQDGAKPSTGSESEAAHSSAPQPPSGNGTSSGKPAADQGGGAPPTGAAASHPYGDYQKALLRASQEKSLLTFDQQFRAKNAWTTGDDATQMLRDIFALHQRKLRGELTADQFAVEIKKLGIS